MLPTHRLRCFPPRTTPFASGMGGSYHLSYAKCNLLRNAYAREHAAELRIQYRWANSIGNVINQFAINLDDNVTSYTQYRPNTSTSAPAPASTAKPVYYLNGAKGVVQQTPYYNSLPFYPDMASGVKEMFIRPFK